MNIHIRTFGCKLNQCESEEIKKNLLKMGHTMTALEESEAVVINTCTVTKQSDEKLINYIKTISEDKKIFLLGCYVSKENVDIENAVLIKNEDKDKAHIIINENLETSNNENISSHEEMSMSRAYLKIQDGCSVFCSYCIISHVRGSVRSAPFEEIVKSLEEIAQNGYKEVVLTGINIASYQYKDINFASLIEKLIYILSPLGIRIRLSSVEPFLFSESLINIFANKTICPHVHIPLQSASGKILTLMKRRYTKEEYISIIKKLVSVNPNIMFSTDVMAGFPGESENDFEETYNLCKEVKFLKMHVFRYSKREGTEAYSYENQVPSRVKLARAKMLTELNKENYEYNKEKIEGRVLSVVIEKQIDKISYLGTSGEYIKAKVISEKPLQKKMLVEGVCSLDGRDIIVKI